MEPLQTNINETNIIESLEKNLKQNEMVHIAEDIHQENEMNSELDEQNNESEQENVQENVQNDENVQENCENVQQNCEVNIRRNSADKNNENEDTLPLKVKIERDDAFDSYSDGSHVFKKYRFRKRDHKPDNKKTESPRIPLKKRIRYEEEDSFDCDQCPRSFDTRQGLLNHMRKHIAHKNIKYTCSLCLEEFDTNDKLIEHKIIHKDMMFTCQKCEIAFTDHCEFLEHEITHTLRSTYKCTECGQYYNKSAILQHFRYHFDRRIECEVCHAMIKKGNLKNHVANHKLIKCVECDQLVRPDTMSYHMIRHTGFKPYQCLFCGKGFANGQQRKVHTRVHTGERPYECDICHQKFKQSTDLNKHKQTHFDKKFQCNVCHKKFIHKESLSSHLTIHNNTQRYKCEICNTSLSTAQGYRHHMFYKHSNDRLFRCNVCDTNHKTKNCINKHNKTLKHRRNVCKKQFIDKEE